MAETSIQWTVTIGPDGRVHEGFTFNPWIGCERVSPECDNCYADRGSKRLAAQHHLTLWDEGSSRYHTSAAYWAKPLAWNRKAEREGVRLKVFCASYGDVLEERRELVEPRKRLSGLIEQTPWLDWLLLTKRPQNLSMLSWTRRSWPANVWAGTTVGVRSSLSRLQWLRAAPATVRFVSCEPLLEDLGAVDFDGIDWVIIGGESGPKARAFDLWWGENVERQARRAGAAVFWKQLGAKPCITLRGEREQYLGPPDGRILLGEEMPPQRREIRFLDSHGGDWDAWPPHLRIREFPNPTMRHALETGAFV